MIMTNKLNRGAYFTDIHFGKKSNSEKHNKDCLEFIRWFIQLAQDQNCDYIAFLGDWHESRNAVDIITLNYSYYGAKMLNETNLPVYFIVGNHDLTQRHTRNFYSLIFHNEFSNFNLINKPTVAENIHKGVLFSPYLFHQEYEGLSEYMKIPFWAGHFEFKGFLVTGYGIKMKNGPDPSSFSTPQHIISGHFHKRQISKNITYMGNAFPFDFSDANDFERGALIVDHERDDLHFFNWENGPKYINTTLSSIDNEPLLLPNAYVQCVADRPITYEESIKIEANMMERFCVNEFRIVESNEIEDSITETNTFITENDVGVIPVDNLVIQMLEDIVNEHVDNNKLIDIYKNLKTETC